MGKRQPPEPFPLHPFSFSRSDGMGGKGKYRSTNIEIRNKSEWRNDKKMTETRGDPLRFCHSTFGVRACFGFQHGVNEICLGHFAPPLLHQVTTEIAPSSLE